MKLKSTVILVIIIFIFAAVIENTLQAREKQDTPKQDSPKQEKSKQEKKGYLEKGGHSGKVISTMNSGGYTYIEFDENGTTLWAACRQAEVSVGDTIEFGRALPMKNFHSRTLKRTWEDILFVSRVTVVDTAGGKPQIHGTQTQLPEGHVPVGPKTPKEITVGPGSVEKAENGYTVEECYSKKKSLDGKQVAIRGKVVKFSSRILGRNWVHIRDGSGIAGSNDLTVTTKDMVQVGDVILVTGVISYDRDFGSGYLFPVIVEDASITIEQTVNPDTGGKQ